MTLQELKAKLIEFGVPAERITHEYMEDVAYPAHYIEVDSKSKRYTFCLALEDDGDAHGTIVDNKLDTIKRYIPDFNMSSLTAIQIFIRYYINL